MRISFPGTWASSLQIANFVSFKKNLIVEGIKVIGFDADDTLWVNEPYYREAENQFVDLLIEYGVRGNIAGKLFNTEIANLGLYGYGIKAFMLSLVECAIELTDGAVTAQTVGRIIGIGKSMLERPIELLEDVKYVLQRLAPHYRLIVATKGDLLDQERKMRKSSISDYFHHIEVMSDKKEQHYLQLLKHLDIAPEEFLMIGNSLKSDIIPPLELGACGIYVPFHTTWAHEEVEGEPDSDRYFQVKHLRDVLNIISH
jgi:putative hydrolase of the HAD superfamily